MSPSNEPQQNPLCATLAGERRAEIEKHIAQLHSFLGSSAAGKMTHRRMVLLKEELHHMESYSWHLLRRMKSTDK